MYIESDVASFFAPSIDCIKESVNAQCAHSKTQISVRKILDSPNQVLKKFSVDCVPCRWICSKRLSLCPAQRRFKPTQFGGQSSRESRVCELFYSFCLILIYYQSLETRLSLTEECPSPSTTSSLTEFPNSQLESNVP